jgi:2-isopropylmalate synthase
MHSQDNLKKALANRHVQIFDTTLRDGQQCPGAGMSFAQNLEYARLAAMLRVDVIEAGFPSASKMDFDIVRSIAEEAGSYEFTPTIAALCQLREEQFISTIESLQALVPSGKARLHTYVPVDPALMLASLGKKAGDKAHIVNDLFRLVQMAVNAGLEVQFAAEGYSRMAENFEFTSELFRAAIEGGASILNCPDTIGGASVFEGQNYFVEKMKVHAEIMAREFPTREITWSVHCHNDLGLAVQNSINAVFNGPARQIEACINGVGERAGNAALEQCVMVLKCFAEQVDAQQPFYTTIAAEQLQSVSDFVNEHMLPRQPHWPVSGANAVLKNPLAYQPFDPRDTGKDISFLFGPLSGGNHAKSIIESFGYKCDEAEKAEIAQFIKDSFPQRRKGITDTELLETYFQYRAPIKVNQIDYSKTGSCSTVTMHGEFFGLSGVIEEINQGNDSALAAVRKLASKYFASLQILSHRSHSAGAGFDAESISEIIIADQYNVNYVGKGKDQDIEISAIKAFLDAVNRAYVDQHYCTEKISSLCV